MQVSGGHLLDSGLTESTPADFSKGKIGIESVRGRVRRASESVRGRVRRASESVPGRARRASESVPGRARRASESVRGRVRRTKHPFRVARGASNIYSLIKDYKSVTMQPVLARQNSEKEVGKMFFFSCGNCCNNDCGSIWQILSQICGFGC